MFVHSIHLENIIKWHKSVSLTLSSLGSLLSHLEVYFKKIAMHPFKGLQPSVSNHKKTGKNRRMEKELTTSHPGLITASSTWPWNSTLPKICFSLLCNQTDTGQALWQALCWILEAQRWIRHSLYCESSWSKEGSLSRGVSRRNWGSRELHYLIF